MRRTLALVGLLALGVLLLANPVTGVLSREEISPVGGIATTLPPTTTTAPPFDPGTAQTTTTPPTTVVRTTFTGPAATSEFGDFVVEITVEDGILIDVRLVDQPSDRKSIRINDSAFPRYEAQAIATQSADLDVISGATVTWEALQVTLVGALDLAGL